MAHRQLPSKKTIHKFWLPRLIELNRVDDESEEDDCFCCGARQAAHRAHIKAACVGGSNSVDNLHLLCSGCHQESELYEGVMYWAWFMSKDINEERTRVEQRRSIQLQIFLEIATDEEKANLTKHSA